MERTTAVFHARDRMHEAMRDLTEHGVVRERISVHADPPPSHTAKPHALFDMPFRVHYAGVGAALGMLLGLAVSGAPGGADTMTTIWLVIVFAGLGALFGSLTGMVVGGLRKLVWAERTTPHRFVLRVECETPDECGAVGQTLASYGGQLEPA